MNFEEQIAKQIYNSLLQVSNGYAMIFYKTYKI